MSVFLKDIFTPLGDNGLLSELLGSVNPAEKIGPIRLQGIGLEIL